MNNNYLGYYAKDKAGNLFQFKWKENDDLYIDIQGVGFKKINKKDYEIINLKIITEEK